MKDGLGREWIKVEGHDDEYALPGTLLPRMSRQEIQELYGLDDERKAQGE